MVFEHGPPTSSIQETTTAPLLPTTTEPNNHNHPPLSSQFKTFANVFISIVGAGVLGLPYTFKKTGYLTGTLTLLSVALLTYQCMFLLIHTRQKLKPLKITSFGDLGFSVCGPLGRFAVRLHDPPLPSRFLRQLPHFRRHHSGPHLHKDLSFSSFTPKTLFIWGCFPFQLGLNSIPTVTHLAPLSIFADVVDIGAMGVVMVEEYLIFLRDKEQVLNAFGGFSVFFYGVGVAVYAFEGIGMMLPLEKEMKDKKKFGRVLGLSMGFISLMYGGFGVLGYFLGRGF